MITHESAPACEILLQLAVASVYVGQALGPDKPQIDATAIAMANVKR